MIRLAPMKNMIVLPRNFAFSVWGNVYVKGWEAFDSWRMRVLAFASGRRAGRNLVRTALEVMGYNADEFILDEAAISERERARWANVHVAGEYSPNEKPSK